MTPSSRNKPTLAYWGLETQPTRTEGYDNTINLANEPQGFILVVNIGNTI